MFVALFITDQRGSPNGRYGVVVMVSLSWLDPHVVYCICNLDAR